MNINQFLPSAEAALRTEYRRDEGTLPVLLLLTHCFAAVVDLPVV